VIFENGFVRMVNILINPFFMKLNDATGWYARIYGELTITEDIDSGFPLNIGAVTITSKDGKRNFVLDSYYTDFKNPETAGEKFEFTTRLDIDTETFPEDDEYNYELLVEELAECTAILYLSRCDMEEGDFDYDNIDVSLVFFLKDDSEIAVKVEVEE
jgi:hypothetical protein